MEKTGIWIVWLIVGALCTQVGADTFTYQNSGTPPFEFFDTGNWQPAGLNISPNTPVNHDLVISNQTARSRIEDDPASLYLGSGSLTLGPYDSLLLENGGISVAGIDEDYPNATMRMFTDRELGNVRFVTQYLADIDLIFGGGWSDSTLTGENPLIRSTIDFRSSGPAIQFTSLSMDEVLDRYLDDFTVFGEPAVAVGPGRNLRVTQQPGRSVYVTAAIFVPEPQTATSFLLATLAIVTWFRRSDRARKQ